jgi:hypothetical protein
LKIGGLIMSDEKLTEWLYADIDELIDFEYDTKDE